ncbi:MAG: hypothetical protein O2983_11220 [Planctomycetota bacterium]|nr:hypothetical protein [Planctomycetota bacterium]MDA0918462.1 hypothetical protein [Planctomycetota bacterium]MDA1160172.1 hypothetical protein [Planctomycetota bacterium]
MSRRTFQTDECVIYCVTKHGCKPSLRARSVAPAPRGETYTYRVDKYWVVDEVLPDNSLVLRTRRGKTRTVSANDPNLRRPSLWEKLIVRHRFPERRSRRATARTA